MIAPLFQGNPFGGEFSFTQSHVLSTPNNQWDHLVHLPGYACLFAIRGGSVPFLGENQTPMVVEDRFYSLSFLSRGSKVLLVFKAVRSNPIF